MNGYAGRALALLEAQHAAAPAGAAQRPCVAVDGDGAQQPKAELYFSEDRADVRIRALRRGGHGDEAESLTITALVRRARLR
jgi:hypothetical protein